MTRRQLAIRHFVAVALLVLVPLVSPHGQAAPRAAGEPGSELQVYVMTMGQGEWVWEKFGHNALGIRDLSTGRDVVYNWGMFSFDQPGFIPRFLRGEMQYWMDEADAELTLLAYQRMNRSVTVQELALSPAQRLELKAFVEWNVRPENTFYRYDYYRDNCSTRVRDALDRVLGGAIRAHADRDTTTQTYRDHSLRLLHDLFWTRTGVDLGLGRATDRPITPWEASFVPMELQKVLRSTRVTDADGNALPLVSDERVLFVSTRPPEQESPRVSVAAFLAVGLAIAALMVVGSYRSTGAWLPASLSVSWALVAGVFGTLLLLLWLATAHVAAHQNMNLLLVHPLWLGVAVLLPFARRGRGTRQAILLVVRACAILTLLGAILALTPWHQPTGAIAAVVVPINLGVYLLALRAVYLAQSHVRAT